MFLVVSLMGREIVAAALDHHKKLCLDAGALCRRLGISERAATDQLSNNKWLRSAFEQLSPTETEDIQVEIASKGTAETLRTAVVQWVAIATKKDQSMHQISMVTDMEERRNEAQKINEQLSDQLSLPVEDVGALAQRSMEKPKSADKKKSEGKKARKKAAAPELDDEEPEEDEAAEEYEETDEDAR